ncbi:MAG: 16S rRNA (uracil(1498)-N(3))-methyltransferase [Bacteroidetes bacterium]|nr:16S rRNA (uracil(1498)-N(3))-methyltransferase [Bacteroidota bacterium]
MHLFFSNIFIDEKTVLLSAEESKHCIKVLRHQAGDTIHIIDGSGVLFKAILIEANLQKCVAEIIDKTPLSINKKYRLHVAISPTKNADRIEWLVEKGTELGIDEFSFIIGKRTEKPSVKTDRLKKITESAIKQSIQGVLPLINEPISLKEFIAQQKNTETKYIAHCAEGTKTGLKTMCENNPSTLVLIGPEGDFTEEEIRLALQNGFTPVSLGATRLRTETAGLFVAAAFKAQYDG